jgi:hypothetical protein
MGWKHLPARFDDYTRWAVGMDTAVTVNGLYCSGGTHDDGIQRDGIQSEGEGKGLICQVLA